MVVEPDRGGEAVKVWLAKSRIRDRVRLVDLGKYKDPSGLYLDDAERFEERWATALGASVPWEQYAARESDAQRNEHWPSVMSWHNSRISSHISLRICLGVASWVKWVRASCYI